MNFKTLTIKNYRSFEGTHALDLENRGLVGVFGRNLDEPRMDSNGSGKSSWLDALDWCLFGVEPRGDKADSIINHKHRKSGALVEVCIVDDDHSLDVKRERKARSGSLRVWHDGTEISTLDTKSTQTLIEEFLGLDRTIFHAAVLFGQTDDFEFADATDKQRKEVLTQVLNLKEIDEWRVKAEALARGVHDSVVRQGEQYNALYESYQRIAGQDYTTSAATWEQNHAIRLAELHGDIETERNFSLPLVDSPPPPPEAPPMPDMTGVVTRLSAARTDMVAAQGGTCPTCGHHTPTEAWRVAELHGAIEVLMQDKAYLESEYQAQQADYLTRLAAHSEAKAKADSVEAQRQMSRDRLMRAQGRLSALQKEENPYTLLARDQAKQLEDLAADMAARRLELEALLDRQQYLEFWKTGLGPKGIKSFILDGRLAEMTEEANRWVHLLTGGTHWVRFESQREVGTGSKKRLVDDFSIRVFKHEPDGSTTERGFRSFSGGEKSRIAVGVDFGLACLVAKRATKAWDVLFLDESFQQSIDRSGKAAIGELLLELAKERSSVFVIDHDSTIQNIFDTTMIVEKTNGSSHIKEFS